VRHMTNQTTTSATYNTPRLGARCADGNRDGDLDHRFDENRSLQIKVNPLPARNNDIDCGGDCGDCLQRRADCVRRNQSVYVECQPDNATPGLSLNSRRVISGTPTGEAWVRSPSRLPMQRGDSATSPAINFTVNAPPALTLRLHRYPAGVMGTAYSQTLQGDRWCCAI